MRQSPASGPSNAISGPRATFPLGRRTNNIWTLARTSVSCGAEPSIRHPVSISTVRYSKVRGVRRLLRVSRGSSVRKSLNWILGRPNSKRIRPSCDDPPRFSTAHIHLEPRTRNWGPSQDEPTRGRTRSPHRASGLSEVGSITITNYSGRWTLCLVGGLSCGGCWAWLARLEGLVGVGGFGAFAF
jgi:hypothetical protein